MTKLIAPGLRQPAHNQRRSHRHATESSGNVLNGTQEPVTPIKATPFACSGRACCRCAGSTAWSLFTRAFCPGQCQRHMLRRNGVIEVWWLRRRCFAKWHDVDVRGGGHGGTVVPAVLVTGAVEADWRDERAYDYGPVHPAIVGAKRDISIAAAIGWRLCEPGFRHQGRRALFRHGDGALGSDCKTTWSRLYLS